MNSRLIKLIGVTLFTSLTAFGIGTITGPSIWGSYPSEAKLVEFVGSLDAEGLLKGGERLDSIGKPVWIDWQENWEGGRVCLYSSSSVVLLANRDRDGTLLGALAIDKKTGGDHIRTFGNLELLERTRPYPE